MNYNYHPHSKDEELKYRCVKELAQGPQLVNERSRPSSLAPESMLSPLCIQSPQVIKEKTTSQMTGIIMIVNNLTI